MKGRVWGGEGGERGGVRGGGLRKGHCQRGKG